MGLEIHAQLATREKLFSNARNESDAMANSQYTEFDAGIPGSLPILNKKCVELAVRAALACECRVREWSQFDRKHYRYADLPLGYQITQYYRPFAEGGVLELEGRKIRIKQMQLEQDSAKTIGDHQIDLNRCGVGLVEIVTEPDLGNAEEAVIFAKTIHDRLVNVGACDGVMALGQMRFDINVSITTPNVPSDVPPLGQRVEIKNVNTFSGLKRAIEAEVQRQKQIIESGGRVIRETRSYCERTRKTVDSRGKEEAADYMFIPDFDIPKLFIPSELIERIKKEMPESSVRRYTRMKDAYGLERREIDALDAHVGLAMLFEEVAKRASSRLVFNFLLNKYVGLLTRNGLTTEDSPVHSGILTEILIRLDTGVIDSNHMD